MFLTFSAVVLILTPLPRFQESQPPTEPSTTASLLALTKSVDEVRLQSTVRQLCAMGARMGGTESGDRAAEFLANEFKLAGLGVHIRTDPKRLVHQENSFQIKLHLPVEAGQTSPGIELKHAWPWGFSPTASGKVQLTLEPKVGAAWLTDNYRSPRKKHSSQSRAWKTGAPAVFLVDGVCNLDGSWPQIRHLAARDDNEAPVFGINAEEGRLLRALLAAGQAVEIEYSIDTTIKTTSARTVVASLPAAAGAKPGFLLYCAHGDSDAGGPGADDNASGAAVVLEIARVWSAAVQAGRLPTPQREVRFAIWGSEIKSTSAYLKQMAAQDDAPFLGVINFDQIGFGSGEDQLNIEPDDLPANRALVQTILKLLKEAEDTPGFPPRWATNKSLGGTDSYVFSGSRLFRENNIPALTLFTSAWDHPDKQPRTHGMPGESWSDSDQVVIDYDLYYHSAGDTPENTTDTEPWNMGWGARVGLMSGLAWISQ